jgi:hypothetical protein
VGGGEMDRAIEAEPHAPRLDPLGRSGGLERLRIEPGVFVQRASEILGVASERMLGGTLDRPIVRQRQLVFYRRPKVATR